MHNSSSCFILETFNLIFSAQKNKEFGLAVPILLVWTVYQKLKFFRDFCGMAVHFIIRTRDKCKQECVGGESY